MTPQEYQTACMRTASPVSRATNDNLRMQGAMGLCGETAELLEAISSGMEDERSAWSGRIVNELGDVLWYAATTAQSIDSDFADLFFDGVYWKAVKEPLTPLGFTNLKSRMEVHATYMMRAAGQLIDSVKKETFQGHPADYGTTALVISIILGHASILAGHLRLSLEDVAEANIEKLRARYPEGFEAIRSTDRKE